MPRYRFYPAELLENAALASAEGNDPSDALGAVPAAQALPVRVVAVDEDALQGLIVVNPLSPVNPVIVRGVGVVGNTGVPTAAPVEPLEGTPESEAAL